MAVNSKIADQNRLWITLSELYLDTELQQYDFKLLAEHILESPFSYEQVRKIDKNEVFPVLYQNMLTVAGVWDGFDPEWLVASILKKKKNRNFVARNYYNFMYYCMQSMFLDSWLKIETKLQELQNAD